MYAISSFTDVANAPQNMDGYSNENGGGFSPQLSQSDSVMFMKKMGAEAAKYGMAIGLKNALDIIPSVMDSVPQRGKARLPHRVW
jgi:Glycoside-hydrolase family GH114